VAPPAPAKQSSRGASADGSGLSVLHVDDLHLAFQHSRAILPDSADSAALYMFWDTPDVWTRPVEEVRDGLIAVGHAMTPALEVVIANHIDQDDMGPLVIEGDQILPSLFARDVVRCRATTDRVRGVFLVEPDEGALLASIEARGRVVAGQSAAGRKNEARAKWATGGGWPRKRVVRACRSSKRAPRTRSTNAC